MYFSDVFRGRGLFTSTSLSIKFSEDILIFLYRSRIENKASLPLEYST